jgi:hypothetical protein
MYIGMYVCVYIDIYIYIYIYIHTPKMHKGASNADDVFVRTMFMMVSTRTMMLTNGYTCQ